MIDPRTVELLLLKSEQYNTPAFIEKDPISIPHRFNKKQDIELSGFFSAMFAWGTRTQIINKTTELIQRMDSAPYDFVLHAGSADLKQIQSFKHRTFNGTDLLFFLAFFKEHYTLNESLETAFLGGNSAQENVRNSLIHFHHTLSQKDYFPTRTAKHVASPAKGSACKRLNMFLRWMVRHDNKGVDFGLWKNLKPSQLICPVDLHVERSIRRLNLLPPTLNINWTYAENLTQVLKTILPQDPTALDFALFGMSIEGYFDSF